MNINFQKSLIAEATKRIQAIRCEFTEAPTFFQRVRSTWRFFRNPTALGETIFKSAQQAAVLAIEPLATAQLVLVTTPTSGCQCGTCVAKRSAPDNLDKMAAELDAQVEKQAADHAKRKASGRN